MAAVIPGCARLFQVSCRLFFLGGGVSGEFVPIFTFLT